VAIFAAVEIGGVFVLDKQTDPSKGLKALAILSVIFISVGLLPQYFEIWKLKEVIGVSILFLAIDISGGIFSILSLVFKPKFDGLASATYISVIVLDGLIVLSALILNPLARRRRAGVTSPDTSFRTPQMRESS